ncbi:Os04g0212900 [Oryza sativa Japonica Group]|uniref:Os04g0212900 protein n=1 Tax=Oryza sativa subsp. japonica TaxID=39947 RepID=A0A0P0W7K7_ORYSJ|nr:Os04g0212900 [Oryza sativa Japonica Group]
MGCCGGVAGWLVNGATSSPSPEAIASDDALQPAVKGKQPGGAWRNISLVPSSSPRTPAGMAPTELPMTTRMHRSY